VKRFRFFFKDVVGQTLELVGQGFFGFQQEGELFRGLGALGIEAGAQFGEFGGQLRRVWTRPARAMRFLGLPVAAHLRQRIAFRFQLGGEAPGCFAQIRRLLPRGGQDLLGLR
jgi:hypothetical protein